MTAPAHARTTAPIRSLRAGAYRIPTDQPEGDGTLNWDSTTLVTVHVDAGNDTGFGCTYCHESAATLIQEKLAPELEGLDAIDVPAAWERMVDSIRNLGRPGISSNAIAAVDVALWDLKARLLGQPLSALLGRARQAVPVYGSGGFTTYSDERLANQLGNWVAEGMTKVKMKVGAEPDRDVERVRVARRSTGRNAELFVDANGAYSRKQALGFAQHFAAEGVSWFEEPVSSDDLEGLRLVRDQGPADMAVAAGEYGYSLPYFRRMIAAGAVDVLQADASRCAGITGFLGVAALCESWCIPLSAHTAPTLHVAACCAARPVVHLEWFHDHARIEQMLFDGAPRPNAGALSPPDAPGIGVEFKATEADRFAL